jgi:hypothetical protein
MGGESSFAVADLRYAGVIESDDGGAGGSAAVDFVRGSGDPRDTSQRGRRRRDCHDRLATSESLLTP